MNLLHSSLHDTRGCLCSCRYRIQVAYQLHNCLRLPWAKPWRPQFDVHSLRIVGVVLFGAVTSHWSMMPIWHLCCVCVQEEVTGWVQLGAILIPTTESNSSDERTRMAGFHYVQHSYTSSHLHVCTLTRLHSYTSSQLHVFTVTHLQSYTSSQLHIFRVTHSQTATPTSRAGCLHVGTIGYADDIYEAGDLSVSLQDPLDTITRWLVVTGQEANAKKYLTFYHGTE